MAKQSRAGKKERGSIRKRVLVSLAALLGILILVAICAILAAHIDSRGTNRPRPDDGRFPLTGTGSKIFYEADYDEDIFEDEEYLEKNRDIRFTSNGIAVSFPFGDAAGYGDASKFFAEYFQTVMDGDYENYGDFFTAEYLARENAFDNLARNGLPFTMQKIYDIEIEELETLDDSAGDTRMVFGVYQVKYKIMENNGTFRNDQTDDGGVVPLYFELVTDPYTGGTHIQNLYSFAQRPIS